MALLYKQNPSLAEGKLKRIHVNQHNIKHNTRVEAEEKPVLTIKSGTTNTYCNRMKIHGPSEVVYAGEQRNPLSCGARVWIETDALVTIEDNGAVLTDVSENMMSSIVDKSLEV